MPSGDKGFTLIEVLVALVIMATSLVALFQGVSVGGKGLDHAHRQAGAVQLAKSLLAQAGVVDPLQPGTQSGKTADGMQWTIAIAGQAEDDKAKRNASLRPFLVTVEVAWKDRVFSAPRSIQLTTVKIGGLP